MRPIPDCCVHHGSCDFCEQCLAGTCCMTTKSGPSSLHVAVTQELAAAPSFVDVVRIELTLAEAPRSDRVLRLAPPTVTVIATTVEEGDHA
jgi:hypothetical protein